MVCTSRAHLTALASDHQARLTCNNQESLSCLCNALCLTSSAACQTAGSCSMQLLASPSFLTLTASHLRQVTQASQVPAAAPATEARANKQSFHCKGKSREALPQVAPQQTHAELMCQMRQDDEPLSVDGKLCSCKSCTKSMLTVCKRVRS